MTIIEADESGVVQGQGHGCEMVNPSAADFLAIAAPI